MVLASTLTSYMGSTAIYREIFQQGLETCFNASLGGQPACTAASQAVGAFVEPIISRNDSPPSPTPESGAARRGVNIPGAVAGVVSGVTLAVGLAAGLVV